MFERTGPGCMGEEEARQMGPLALAYLGDTVYDLYVRTSLLLESRGNAGALHRKSIAIVNARAQAGVARRMFERLSKSEQEIFMRGRNAKSATVPRNMSVADYRQATALEAVVGYCYLTGRLNTIEQVIKEALHAPGESES